MLSKITCTSESVFRGALTRGANYTPLAVDETKRQVRITGDNGRARWFPFCCFDLRGGEAPTLVTFDLEDCLEVQAGEKPIDNVEVSLTLSSGQRRWCVFVTPAGLAHTGHCIDGTQVLFHYCNRHLIVAEELTFELIGRMLREIDSKGELTSCTLPIESESDDACDDGTV